MEILFILLIGVVLFGMGAGYVHNRNIRKKLAKGELEEAPPIVSIDESLLAAVSKQIEYYDDEELDRFKGRAPNAYTDKEIEEFRDILYTMQETDVAGWVRSLQLRGINLPDEVKDEVFLIVGERRFESVKN